MRAADPDVVGLGRGQCRLGQDPVLTQRVLRLLLSGVAPDSILCLTYTKAAAAEMRDRVADVARRMGACSTSRSSPPS